MEKIMNFKDLFHSMFAYNPPVEYNFSLPENSRNRRNQR